MCGDIIIFASLRERASCRLCYRLILVLYGALFSGKWDNPPRVCVYGRYATGLNPEFLAMLGQVWCIRSVQSECTNTSPQCSAVPKNASRFPTDGRALARGHITQTASMVEQSKKERHFSHWQATKADNYRISVKSVESF